MITALGLYVIGVLLDLEITQICSITDAEYRENIPAPNTLVTSSQIARLIMFRGDLFYRLNS